MYRGKRALDVAFSAAALVAASPLLALAGALVRLDSPGPALFRQTRVGRHGKPFTLLKLRTMCVGAERKGPRITAGGDARITRVGRLLRAAKIDELPQFVNVLRGDMSIVGPRPELPEYVERFKDAYELLLTVRPGITDPASVRYRHEARILAASDEPEMEYLQTVLPTKIALARDYVERASMWTDVKVVAATVTSLFRG